MYNLKGVELCRWSLTIVLIMSVFILHCSKKLSNDTIIEANSTQLLFITMRIYYDSLLQKSTIEILDKQAVKGKRNTSKHIQPDTTNYLKIDFYRNNNLSKTKIISHPLRRSVEYESHHKLETKLISLDTIEFFERIEHSGIPDYISIFEKLNNNEIKILNKKKW